MRATLVALCVVALALTAIGWTETERGYPVSAAAQDPAPRSVSARSTHPVSFEAKRWHPNPAWMRDALCIYHHENGGYGWHVRNSPYSGGMQFLVSTWRRAGGRREPADWAPREQLYRSWVIWRQDGGSWREWPTTSRLCGVR